jgi:GT2 family glycosyltransferase
VVFTHQNFPQVHVVETGSNLGYARGFNAGLEYAEARSVEYFMVMNNDTVIDREALSALMEVAMSKDRVGFVTGKVYFYDHPDVLQTAGRLEDPLLWGGKHIGRGEKDTGQYEDISERAFADDVFTLVNRKMYDEVGGYDPQFFLQAEEFDWQVRAKKRGWRIYYTPKAKLWHRVSKTSGGEINAISPYFHERSCMIVHAKHGGFWHFIQYYAWEFGQVFIGLLAGLIKLDRKRWKIRLGRFFGFWAGTWCLIHGHQSRRVPSLIQWLNER